jgi:hypothetical protein
MSDLTNVLNPVVRRTKALVRLVTISGIYEKSTIAAKGPGILNFIHMRDVVTMFSSLSREPRTCEIICGVCINRSPTATSN